MAFGSFNSTPNSTPMAEINVIPLVDIMLVLLVIFIITAPLLTHAVKVDLPQASSTANQTQADKVELAINGKGEIFWDGEAVTKDVLNQRLTEAGQRKPAPELHVRADRDTRYELVAQTLSAAGRAGVSKIGFITDPGAAP